MKTALTKTPAMRQLTLACLLAGSALSGTLQAQDACPYRGELDAMYCDANKDLVADAPSDPKKFRNPNTLVFAFTPVEDPSIYEKLFQPFMAHLSQCVGKKTLFFAVQSNSAQIEAMRSGRLHLAAFSTGPTNFAVNIAGAVPFAIRGTEKGPEGMMVQMIVRKDSPYKTLADLKGKKIAHTSPSSNSGNLAPRALFPALGLTPDKDYQVVYSGKHDQSVLGVKSGDYDAAPVASDVLAHMIERGAAKPDDFNIIYTSDRLQEKLELHKLAVINNEQRKAEDKLNKLRLAFSELERKRTLEVNAVNAKAKAARLALDEAEAKQVDKLDIAEAVLFEAHDQYVEKAVSRGWVA